MSSELKAGLFVLAAISALAYMTTRLTQNRYSFVGTKTYYTVVGDATGLLASSKIKMAGLDVGQIGKMELAGKQARIELKIAADMVVHKDGTVAVKAIGFLGDKYIELYPGTDQAPVLAEGGYITEGQASGSIDQLTAKTTQLVDSLREITDLLKGALKGGGPEGDTRLDRILDNMERFSEGLADIDKVGDILARIEDIMGNISTVTGKVSRGEGTIGKLLTDTETIDRLNSTLSGVQKIVGKADKMAVVIDAKAGALTRSGGRSSFSVALQPTYDKYYLVGVSTRPQGTRTTTRTTTVVNPDNPGATSTVVLEDQVNESGFGIDAQLAKRFGDATFRLGLFESTGGVGVDYNFLSDRAKLFSEVYRFRKGEKPQVNVGAEVQVYKPFYLWTGGDFLLTSDSRSFFVGGGLRFTDQDIKTLVGAAIAGGALK